MSKSAPAHFVFFVFNYTGSCHFLVFVFAHFLVCFVFAPVRAIATCLKLIDLSRRGGGGRLPPALKQRIALTNL